MKKLLFLLLLLPSLAWGQVSTSGVSLSGCSSGGASAAACDPDTNEIGTRTLYSAPYNTLTNTIFCRIYTPDCSGTLGKVWVYSAYADAGTDHIKVRVFNSADQSAKTTNHAPAAHDEALSGTSWVELTTTSVGWANSGATKMGGTVSSGSTYYLCWISPDAWKMEQDTTAGIGYVWTTSGDVNYESPPATLDDSWTGYEPRDYTIYVEIE